MSGKRINEGEGGWERRREGAGVRVNTMSGGDGVGEVEAVGIDHTEKVGKRSRTKPRGNDT